MSFSLLASASESKLDPLTHVLPHHPFGGTWFTNHHFMSLVVLVAGFALLQAVAKRMPLGAGDAEHYVTKGRLAQFFEMVCVFLRDEMTRPLLGDLTDKYIKYVWSTFFFILFANVLGLIPFGPLFGLVQLDGLTHLGGALTGNINFTAGLAIVSLFMIVFVGLRENGFKFVTHMWPVPFTPVSLIWVLLPVGLLIFALEILGLFIKAFALCVRLFANMVAGHMVLGALIIMAVSAGAVGKGASVLGATAFSFLELFVAFLQAYIFTFLTVIFISLGAVSHDDHDDHHAGLDEGAMPGDAMDNGLAGTQTAASP